MWSSTSGLVTANAAGTATITVTTEDGNKTATRAMTVTIPAPYLNV
ncbi:MAG: Ig-like domain-containing protein [Tannerella sp.]|nr:Ig-like domain-containing protein [Tannerella sp.]